MKSCLDNIAVIPARKYSKRLNNKNMLSIGRHSLISRAVETAKQSNLFRSILISTDIPENQMDIHFDDNIIYDRRPDDLCSDTASSDSVIKYIIAKYGFDDETVITLIQPTSPMRTADDLISAYMLYSDRGKPVVSALKLHNLYGLDEDESISRCNDDMIMINGAIYIFPVREFNERKSIPIEGCSIYFMNYINSIDIDCEYQYNAARILIENKYHHK